MKRAVICVKNPELHIPELENEYSLMIVSPDSSESRMNYLLEKSDYSLLVTDTGTKTRNGKDYPGERLYWYTSGTTGDSKFYGFNDEQKNIMTQSMIDAYHLDANHRYSSVMPLWHAHGQHFYWATKQAGCETKFFNTKQFHLVEASRPTLMTAIPKIINFFTRYQFPDLKLIVSASVAFPLTKLKIAQDYYRVPILDAFGMTEAMGFCITNPLNGPIKPGTVGRPFSVEAKLEGNRLLIKGPTVVVDGWMDTGDLATVDEDGYYTIIGRSVEQINVNGIKVNPLSLEAQLLEKFFDLQQVTIFGEHDVNCIYVGDVAETEIRRFLLSLGDHCFPKLLIKTDEIPTNENGKISRKYLSRNFIKC